MRTWQETWPSGNVVYVLAWSRKSAGTEGGIREGQIVLDAPLEAVAPPKYHFRADAGAYPTGAELLAAIGRDEAEAAREEARLSLRDEREAANNRSSGERGGLGGVSGGGGGI